MRSLMLKLFRIMSAMRQPSEWGIGRIKSLWSYLEFKVCFTVKLLFYVKYVEELESFEHACKHDVHHGCPPWEYSLLFLWEPGTVLYMLNVCSNYQVLDLPVL